MIRFSVCTALALVLLTTAACGGEVSPTGPGPAVVLTLPASVTGIAGVPQSERLYKFVVPAGTNQLVVSTSGGIGDADLYVREAQAPSPTFSDCSPQVPSSSTETCTMTDPDAGEWYVMLVGYTAYSGVTLTVTVTGAP